MLQKRSGDDAEVGLWGVKARAVISVRQTSLHLYTSQERPRVGTASLLEATGVAFQKRLEKGIVPYGRF